MASRVTPSAAQLASAAAEVLRAQPDYGSKRVGEAVEAAQPSWLVPHDSAKLRKAVRARQRRGTRTTRSLMTRGETRERE